MDKYQRYGVVYKDEDYAGFIRRIFIMVLDLAIALLVIGIGFWLDDLLHESSEYYDSSYCFYASLFVVYLYLTLLKSSRFGSIGQRLTNTKIETIYGKRPKQGRMTLRLLYWVLGPFNFLTDLVFMLAIKERRSIRDCFCNTIVVSRDAEAVDSHAPVRVTRIYALGLNLMYESCNSVHS